MRAGSYVPCIALLSSLAVPVTAQCHPIWHPGTGVPGVQGTVSCEHWWDPDGAGPATPLLVIGGFFYSAGTVSANSIVAYDPANGSWSAFDEGLNNSVVALATLPAGDLVAAGSFSFSGSTPVAGIARWTGSQWVPLGGGLMAPVACMVQMPNGDLVVGGSFQSTVGGVPVHSIARWNGSAWSDIGGGFDPFVLSLAVMPNGDLVAGGSFTTAGGNPAAGVARWNGSTWTQVGGGIAGGAANSMTVLANGDLVVGGTFSSAGGAPANRVAVWNGSQWSAMGAGLPGNVRTIAQLSSGGLLAGGEFGLTPTSPLKGMAIWNGSLWVEYAGGAYSMVLAIIEDAAGDVYVGGVFSEVVGAHANSIARFDGTTWFPLDTGFNGAITHILEMANGDFVLTGNFTVAPGGVAARRVVRWNGTNFVPMGNGFAQEPASVARTASGDIYVAVGGGVARWSGTSWVYNAPNGQTKALLALPDGTLVAGGWFVGGLGLARFDGSTWSTIPNSANANISCLCPSYGNTFTAGGDYVALGGPYGAVWNQADTSWVNLGFWPGETIQLLHYGEGTTHVVSEGPSGITIRRNHNLSGPPWLSVGPTGNYLVQAMTALPGGDLLAGGRFDGPGTPTVMSYDGASWQPFDGPQGATMLGYGVNAMQVSSRGDLLMGGYFHSTTTGASAFFARASSSCPTLLAVTGPGCPSSGGGNILTATQPWLGTRFTLQGDGLPAQTQAIVLLGFQGLNLPLASVFATSPPGCTISVQPEIIEIRWGAGWTQYLLDLPRDVALAGLGLECQMLPIDMGNFEVTATNGLIAVMGMW